MCSALALPAAWKSAVEILTGYRWIAYVDLLDIQQVGMSAVIGLKLAWTCRSSAAFWLLAASVSYMAPGCCSQVKVLS